MEGPEDWEAAIAGLRRQWRLDFHRVRDLLRNLPADTTTLVQASGLPRREVEAVLSGLGPLADRPPAPSLLAGGPEAWDDAELGEPMEAFAAGRPPSRWRLDHVPATPETMTQRAMFLAGRYDLSGASVLCLGDHDLTSVALKLVAPAAEVAVVDVDEMVLEHIGAVSSAEGLGITCAFADLRLGLPPSLAAGADLVFTDPPYTAEGIRLFLERGLQALRRSGHERLAFCYGQGEHHLGRYVEVQGVLGDLRLAIEAVMPAFNRYAGAEAIGSRSHLYVCRPTPKTRSRRARASDDARIYSRGPAAREAAPARRSAAVADVLAAAGRDEIVIDLHPHHGASLVATLLRQPVTGALVIVAGRDLAHSGILDDADPHHRLLASAYDLDLRHPARGEAPAVLGVVRRSRPASLSEGVLAYLATHPGAKVVNAWREALVATGSAATKNEARALIEAAAPDPALHRLRIWELPRSTRRHLVAAVEQIGSS